MMYKSMSNHQTCNRTFIYFNLGTANSFSSYLEKNTYRQVFLKIRHKMQNCQSYVLLLPFKLNDIEHSNLPLVMTLNGQDIGSDRCMSKKLWSLIFDYFIDFMKKLEKTGNFSFFLVGCQVSTPYHCFQSLCGCKTNMNHVIYLLRYHS